MASYLAAGVRFLFGVQDDSSADASPAASLRKRGRSSEEEALALCNKASRSTLPEVVLSLRGQLGRDPERRRRAQELGLPILVIKAPSLHQIQRALERLLERRGGAAMPAGASSSSSGVAAVGAEPPAAQLEDAHGALEECRLAVERVVLPEGRPVELLPRSDRVREMQAELVSRYRLRSAVFGRGNQQRLRVFPA